MVTFFITSNYLDSTQKIVFLFNLSGYLFLINKYLGSL